ncbi:WXG100-like domain-containing protein [Streptomyces sp. NPDC055214]
MIFILTGEKLIDADEDLAFDSRMPYSGLGRKLNRISALIDKSVHDIAESMPDDLSKSYAKAMGTLTGEGGKNYLLEFADQLDKIAEGRRKTSMDIMESKWQVIAEVIRLLIEIAIYLAMSFFTGGASASQIMMAKLRSRFMILTTLTHLLQRLHIAPSLTEAFAEAFTTFAVRLAMMNFAPDGRRPDGFDWNDILKSAAFGAAAGGLTSIFNGFAKNIVDSYDSNFFKNGPGNDFKNNPNGPNTPPPDLKNNVPDPKPNPRPTPEPTPTPSPTPTPGPTPNTPDPGPSGSGPNPTNNPFSFTNNPNLWRNNYLLNNYSHQPGALAGHYGLKGTADFIAAGAGEALAEILIKGAFDGDWSTSWSTFVGAGISSQVESTLTGGALNTGAELRNAIDNLRNQPPPTVSSGSPDPDGSTRSGDGSGRTDGAPRPSGTSGGDGSALNSPTPVPQQTTGQGDFTDGQSPPPYVAENPPPYSPGPMPVTAAENELWQQVHHGSAEARDQALRDLADLRGSQPPGSTEIGVRDSLHGNLSQLPEVRVVPAGNTPGGQVDADQVRRTLDGFGTPVTVDTPITPNTVGAPPATTNTPVNTTAPDALAPGATPENTGAGAPDGDVQSENLGVGAPGSDVQNVNLGVGAPGGDVQTSPDGVAGQGGDLTGAGPEQGVGGPVGSSAPSNSAVPSNSVVPGNPAAPSNSASSGVDTAVTPGPAAENPGVGALDTNVQSENLGVGAPDSDIQTSPDGVAGQAGDLTGAGPEAEQGVGGPVASPAPGNSASPGMGAASAPGAGAGAQPSGTSTGGGTQTPSATQPSGARTPDGSRATTDDAPATTRPMETTTPADGTASPESTNSARDSGMSSSPDALAAPGGPAPASDLTTVPPKVSTTGSYADRGDTKVSPVGPAGSLSPPQASPLTIVVSEVPPPGEGAPEAAELLDGAGADRAVVLGPAVALDGAGPPVRAAAELTREGPGTPVRVRPLTGPPAAPPPDGTGAPDTEFPGADVLLPLAHALGPAPSAIPDPATQSSATPDGHNAAPAPDGRPKTVSDAPPTAVLDHGVDPDAVSPADPGDTKLATLSRPWSEPATDLHLESGRGDGDAGGGRGPGNGGTPPPPPSATPDNSPAAPPVGLPPTGRIVVRPASSTETPAGGTTPARPAGEPVVTTLDGHTVPVAQLRRWVPDASTGPQPGRAVQTLTISQSVAEDGTAHSAGRRALLGEDIFRGVRVTSAHPDPAPSPAPEKAAAPPVRRTVFTGPPAPLPGAGTQRGADYFAAHGTPRTVTLGAEDARRPTVKVSGVQLGEVLKSWAPDGDQDRPLVLFSCETGRQPEIAGLPVAQHVANRTGRPVYAPTTEVGTARDRDGAVRAVLTEGPDGPGRWRLFTPEPSGADLDALARAAGLHTGPDPADAFARARTLQQIRTLRDTFGPDAEQQPENAELLVGLAFVDGLRWLSPDTAARYGDGRMTPDLLRRMVVDRSGVIGGATPDAGVDPTTEQYTEFLVAAAELRGTSGPEATLDALLPPPPPVLPPTTLVSPEDVRGLAYAPSAQITWSLSGTPLPLSELGLSPEDTVELARRRPDLAPAQSRPESPAQDVTLLSKAAPGTADIVHADGLALRRLDTPGGGNCLFRSLLDSARGQDTPPAWAARNVAGLRRLLSDRITGSELGDTVALAFPDPVFAVVDDLRMRAIAGVRDPAEQSRITRLWNRIAQDVVTDGDTDEWQRILRESDYPHLADVAPTPADAKRLGAKGLVASAAELSALWASPFADLLPEALAHTLDLDLRLVQPDPQTPAPGNTRVNTLNPGGQGPALHLAYNGTDHYDALIPASAPLAPVPETTPDPTVPPADVSDPGTTPDPGDLVPLETQLDRYRPARLLTGPDARPPGAVPSTVTFEDGSRLPTVLISPDTDPAAGAVPQGPAGLLTGPGTTTLRSPEQVAEEILGKLPTKLRGQFDEAELLHLLTEQPGAFTAPRGARFVGREKSGVGHEMTVEAIPYNRWERFSDIGGGTVRVDTARRGQSGTGGGRSVGFGRRIAGGLSMGPPLNWLLKLGVSLGWTRRTDYAQGTAAYNQTEWRAHEGSHLHLDDVHYRVRVDRVTEGPRASTGPTDQPNQSEGSKSAPSKPSWRRIQVHAAEFAMRDGLSWRLPDDLTVPYSGPRRAPKTLTFPDGVEPRMVDTTGLHLTDPPEDVALAMSGARPGSSAHRTLVSYVRPGRLLALFGRFAGPVTGPELSRGSGQHPLGHLIVERSVPHRATLVTESVKAELRELTQTTYQNERGHVRDTRLGVQVTAGPNYTLVGPDTDVRLQGGPLVRADLTTGRGHYLGADAARKTTGRVRNTPVALYRVERTLMVRKPGEPPSAARPVRVVSLDWISTQDARRLAGWDSRTPGQAGPDPYAEPPVPWYLSREDPVHLSGQVRAEGFWPVRPQTQPQAQVQPHPQPESQPLPESQAQAESQQPQQPAPQDPMRAFADSVLDTLHRAHPSLFVPPMMLRHPRLAKFWYGDGRMRTALHNDRQVREALNRPTLAQSLDDLTTTGVPVTLTEDGKVRRGHHTLILKARLTDRQFETTMSERALRNAVIGTEVSGQGQQASTTLSGGVELGVSPRDHDKVADVGLPRQAGSVAVGVRHARTDQKATRNTVAVTHDHLMFQTGADLYSYQVELSASFEGHRRPRGWARLASVGLLGAGVFVSKVEEQPLFSRGDETVGRVELAVPSAHGSDRHAPADPPPGTTAPTAAAPVPQHLSSVEADQLLDGVPPLTRVNPTDRQLTEKLLSVPHVVLSTEGGPQRQELMQDTADRASGTSWHVSAPGAPVRTALRRAMANLSVAGQLGQYLGPFGSRVTGLNGAGPFRTHYLKAAVRGELENFRVKSDPKPASLEATVGNEHRVLGSASTVTHTTLGLQGTEMPLKQAPGQQAVIGSYSTALQYAWGKGRGIAQTLTRGRNTTLSFAGRMYLVVADATETVAVRDRWTAAMGAAGTRAGARISSAAGRLSGRLGDSFAPRPAAAALQRIRDAVMFHLPMQDVIEAGLAPDGLGTTTPHNLGGGYRLPPYLRDRRFPTHPTGQLDASGAARQLTDQLAKIGVSSHDQEQALQRLSPDFLQAHLHELTTGGMTLPVRYRTWSSPFHLPVGGSPGRLRFELTPVTTTVDRLRTGFELEDYRTIARDNADGTSQDRGADVTLSGGERAADSGILIAHPSLQGTAAKQRASTRTETAGTTSMPNIATTQAHAEIITSYTLTVTMTDASGDQLAPRVDATPVGSLNEILPASLLTPDGDGADGALTEQDVPKPERAVRMLTAEQARPENISAWRNTSTDGAASDILPFDDQIGSGILAVDIRGAANVQDALTLATARADGIGDSDLGERHTGATLDARVRIAHLTSLTGIGTAPAQAQEEATTQVGLTAGFREALGTHGAPLPTQASSHLFGQSHTADSRLYATMHRNGARLLAVENKPRMEAMQRAKTSDASEAGITDNVEGAVGTAPLAGNSNAGVTNPGATVPIGGTNDGTTLKGAADTTLGTHVKVVTDRSMLFALPVSWLAVAEVDHRFTDSRPLHALGKAKRGPRAAEAETTALVWLREDLARDYGLLDDTTFPPEARTAWDDQAKAAADLATAEKGYYDARARAREAWLDLSPEEQAALGDDNSGPPADLPQDMIWSPAVVSWQAARQEVHRWGLHTDAAAADHHRLHLAASRLTAHHQDPASGPAPDLPRKYTEPAWRSEAPEPYVITDGVSTEGTTPGPRTITSPDGATVREVHDMPHDGASFFHALLATAGNRGRLPYLLGKDLAGRFANTPGDPAVTAEAIGAARDRLALALGDDGNEDLLDALALDAADTFTQDELDFTGVRFTPAQQAEFDAFGRLPQTYWPTPGQRAALAVAALARPFAAEPRQDGTPRPDGAPPERRAGDHGGADLLPALAARVLGTPLTVVTGEGRDQLFLPHGTDPAAVDPAADPVLFTTGGFFSAALPPGAPVPVATALPGATTAAESGTDAGNSVKPPVHRSHTTAPWLPPVDSSGPRYRLARDGVLTAPDGATYTQGAPTGRGNGFFGALSTAMRQAAREPGLDPRQAARLRIRAEATPAQLMRLNGLPGDRAERDSLFTPPPLRVPSGAPTPSQDARDGHLRRHLAEAPWGPGADRAVAEWAATATGTTVTLIEENGTAHSYTGPGGESGPHIRLRRRGGDFVPLKPQTPAPPAPAPDSQDPAAVPLPPSPTGSDLPGLLEEEAYELSTLSGNEANAAVPTTSSDTAPATPPEPSLRSFKLGNFEFTNLNQADKYVEKAVRIVELLDEHGTISSFVGGRPVRITLHVRTTETPADVRDLGDAGVEINLASYYFEKYDIGYVMGMLAHEIGLHPLASANTKIPEEEDLYAGMPLLVPGLESLKTPRFMNTEGAGQADHVMAAFPHTIRHGIYRDIVIEMAQVLAQHARVGVGGAKAKDVTDLIDTYLMDLASIAVTNDHRARAVTDPSYTARSYNAYKAQLAEQLAPDSPLHALLPADKGRFGVLGDFAALATSVGTNNRGDSIQQPAAPDQTGTNTVGNPGEARPRLPQANTDTTESADDPGPFKLGNFEFTNLNQTDRYIDKAVRIIELLDEHSTIKSYVGGRPVRITLHLRTTETPADVRDLGDDGVQINLASYYFEKYDTGYVMGMLAHEIGLHPLASRNTDIPEQEQAYQGMPLPVPGLTDLATPRAMNTEEAGQADHIMAAYPRTIRHGIYRDIVIEMATVLARRARVGVAGAKSQDVTDLFDTYLMDLASIAVTSDYRVNAVKEPNYTARVYNAYKEMLQAQLAENPALRDLLPSNKSLFGVARSFTQLATSIATNNRGDSIQPPAARATDANTGEARPRLPQTAPSATPNRGPRDSRPRFVVRSGFDVRRFSYQGEPVTDLTVRVALRGTNDQASHVFDQLSSGVEEFLNDPEYRLFNGDRLHVTVEYVDPADAPHLTVNLAGRDEAMDQITWWADAAPVQLVHELTHQLGLRDEYRDTDSPHRPHILGSLLGNLNEAPEDPSLAPSGLRDRHLALLGALIGDVTPAPQHDTDQEWSAARSSAVEESRESIWVDPVSLPRPADDGMEAAEVPAHMPQDSDNAPAAPPEADLRPFKLGNFEFTNLNQADKYVEKAVRIVELLDEHGTINSFVGGRPVRITLHVRTTETPADVRDLGDAGVEINLASYYFEKYDIGYVMGMLAHEIGLHPLASANTKIPEEEDLYAGMPLLVPGLESLKTPRFMNTEGAGQADHVMAAFPHTIRHGIYRDIVIEMAQVLAQHARVGVGGAKAKDVTDLIDTYLMDLASIAVTNDHRARAVTDPSYTARSYNAYKAQLAEQLAPDSPLHALLPADKGRFGVLGDFAALATSVGTNNRGDSIQQQAGRD